MTLVQAIFRSPTNIWFCLVLCVLSGLISLWLGQDAMGDLRNYHYYNAFALVHGRESLDVAAAQMQTFLNPILDLPYYFLTLLLPRSPKLIAFCMGIPYGVLTFFAVRIAGRLFAVHQFGRWAVALAVLFGISGSATFAQLGLSTNEIPVAALLIAGVDFLLDAIDKKAAGFSRSVLLAGFLAGLAVGGKLTAAPYAVALAAATIAGFDRRDLPRTLVALGIAGTLGTLTTGGYWMAHLVAQYGNPVFPYHNEIFGSAWADKSTYVDGRFFPRSALQTLLYPFWWLRRNAGLVTEYPFADGRIAAVFAAGALAALVYVIRRPAGSTAPTLAWRAVIVFWVTGYVMWLRTFSIYRYAVPLEIVGGFMFVGAIRSLLPSRPGMVTVAAGLLGMVVAYTTIYPDWGHIPFQPRAVPVSRPVVPDHALIVMAGDYPIGYVAALTPASVRSVGAYSNFVRPPASSATALLVADTIAHWPGPIEVLQTRVADAPARSVLVTEYHLAVTTRCQTIRSAWDDDALQLCEAYRENERFAYHLGTAILFDSSHDGSRYGLAGWSFSEPWGVWSLGADADLVMSLDEPGPQPLELAVTCFGIAASASPERHVDVFANDELVAHWILTASTGEQHAAIPPVKDSGRLRIRFHVLDPKSPAELRMSDDPRELGIAIERLTITAAGG